MANMVHTFAKGLRVGVCALLLLVLCVVLAGCSASPSEEAKTETAITFTDDLGNKVVVDNPERVVACMGSFANIWELSGGSLVGVSDDTFAEYELSSKDVATIGDFTSPNLEQIIALNPDFVIMTGSSAGKAGSASQVDLKAGLEESGISVAYFTVTTFDDYLRMLKTCCDITGRDDLYEQNGEEVQQRINALVEKANSSEEKPRVLLATTYSGGVRVQNSDTMTGDMLSDLGAINIADENPSLLKDFSLESVIEENPDYILIVPMGNNEEAAKRSLNEMIANNPAWASLDAVKNGNYLTLDPQFFLYKPNAAWDESYQKLFDILYA